MTITNLEEAVEVLNWLNMMAGMEETGMYKFLPDTNEIIFVNYEDDEDED